MHRSTASRLAALAAAVTLSLPLAACGGKKEEAAAPARKAEATSTPS